MRLSYVFMGSPPIAVTILKRLVESNKKPTLIVTQPPRASGRGKKIRETAVEEYAKANSLEVVSSVNVNDPRIIQRVAAMSPDIILVAAFGQILKQSILQMAKIFCLNIHASLLPKYRGAAPVQRAIWNGESVTGITIQKIAPKLDTGDILLQRELKIDPKETSGELLERLAVLASDGVISAFEKIESGKFSFAPQDESQATYAKKIEKEEALIDWNQSAGEIYNQIRALQPWPVAETRMGELRLKIFGANPVPLTSPHPPGQMVTDHRTYLQIVCASDSALSLTEIQVENRKRVQIQEFLQAYRGKFPYTRVENEREK